MQNTGFQEAVETVCQEDRRYNPEAYAFLRDSLEGTIKRRKKSKKEPGPHVGAVELLDGFRIHALAEFGPMADVGQMVFNLVKAGIFGKTDEDTAESFRDVFDFPDAFVAPFRPLSGSLNEDTSLQVEIHP
jgi:uncharacterized repeat protein (TIGR04138 family)